MSCVDNIPTVCAPWPLFSRLQLLVGLQLKHSPSTGSFHISSTIPSAFGSAVGLIPLCPIQEVRAWSDMNNWKNVRSKEGKSCKCCETKWELRLLLITNWASELINILKTRIAKQRKDVFLFFNKAVKLYWFWHQCYFACAVIGISSLALRATMSSHRKKNKAIFLHLPVTQIQCLFHV